MLEKGGKKKRSEMMVEKLSVFGMFCCYDCRRCKKWFDPLLLYLTFARFWGGAA
jgi:hypothetical protein